MVTANNQSVMESIMEEISLEDIVLQNLLTNESYIRKVIAFIKEDYFSNRS